MFDHNLNDSSFEADGISDLLRDRDFVSYYWTLPFCVL